MFSRILVANRPDRIGRGRGQLHRSLWPGSTARSVRVVHVNELLVGGRGLAAETELEAMDIVDRAVARLRGAGVDADGVHHPRPTASPSPTGSPRPLTTGAPT